MRKILLSVDIEGVAGVTSKANVRPSGWEYPSNRRWMTAELNAVAEAAFEAGYDEVIASDGHGCSQNLDPDLIHENIRLVRNWPRPFLQMQGIEDPDVEACAFVGYHAPAGTTDSLLAHTFSSAAFRSVKLNGEIASEGYFNAALAGEFDKPVLFVSGDRQTVDDAKRYAQAAVRFVAKESFGARSQMSLAPRQVCRALKENAAQAFRADTVKPFKLDPPFVVEIEMTTPMAVEMLCYLPWIERLNAWALRATFQSMADAMRFISFAILYSPSGETPF